MPWNNEPFTDERYGPVDPAAPHCKLGPIADPVLATDAATKGYVDALVTTGKNLSGLLAARPAADVAHLGFTYTATDQKTCFLCVSSSAGVYSWALINGAVSAPWATQLAWGINASTGSDAGAGSVAAPLATWAEFRRRIRAVGGIAVALGNVVVTIVGNLALTDPIDLRGLTPPEGSALVINGTPVTVFTGAFTTVNLTVPATNTQANVIDTSIPTSWTASGGILKRGRITGGARAGAFFFPVKDLGSKTARIVDAIAAPAVTFPFNAFGATFPTLQVGDPYVIESLSTVDSIVPDVGCVPNQAADGAFTRIIIQNIQTLNGTIAKQPAGCPITYIGCVLNANQSSEDDCYGCIFSIFFCPPGGNFNLYGCGFVGGFANTQGICGLTVCLSQGANLQAVQSGSFQLNNAIFGVFDCTGVGVSCSGGGTVLHSSAGAKLYGAGNSTYGIQVKSASRHIYTNKPTITGTTNDTIVGGVATAYASVPVITAANGATLVLDA